MATGAGLAEWKQTHGKKKAKCVLTSTGLLMEGLCRAHSDSLCVIDSWKTQPVSLVPCLAGAIYDVRGRHHGYTRLLSNRPNRYGCVATTSPCPLEHHHQ